VSCDLEQDECRLRRHEACLSARGTIPCPKTLCSPFFSADTAYSAVNSNAVGLTTDRQGTVTDVNFWIW